MSATVTFKATNYANFSSQHFLKNSLDLCEAHWENQQQHWV